MRSARPVWLVAVGIALVAAGSAIGEGSPAPRGAEVGQLVAEVVRQTARACPLTSPDDQAAFDRCREALFRDSTVHRSLAPFVLWGRTDPSGKRLKDTTLTQFAPEVWTGLYLSLFMLRGDHELDFDRTEKLFRARLPALFRNALDPGQYPYPFWHDARKWADYQAANELTLWIDPARLKIVAAQFSARGVRDPRLASAPRTPPAFDGKWVWTDERGRTQPQPTLFVGLMRPDNPYLGPLESAYRDLADALRKGTCNACHVPGNPERLTRLVLMQTPAHAAGEIKRIMRAVREDKMPLDEMGLYKELDPGVRAALLNFGAAFDALVDAARDWEAKHPPRPGALIGS
jgi:hypothetical protein